ESDLKQFPNGAWALDPDDSARSGLRRSAGLELRDFEIHNRILRNVMFRLVLAAVAVDHHGGGAFLEGLAERVHTRDCERHGLHDARATALLIAEIAGCERLGHTLLRWQTLSLALRSDRVDRTEVLVRKGNAGREEVRRQGGKEAGRGERSLALPIWLRRALAEEPETAFLYRLENIFSSVFIELGRLLIIWCTD